MEYYCITLFSLFVWRNTEWIAFKCCAVEPELNSTSKPTQRPEYFIGMSAGIIQDSFWDKNMQGLWILILSFNFLHVRENVTKYSKAMDFWKISIQKTFVSDIYWVIWKRHTKDLFILSDKKSSNNKNLRNSEDFSAFSYNPDSHNTNTKTNMLTFRNILSKSMH